MKNGKLFGKLNIIDLLIILIVLAAAAFVGLRLLGRGAGSEAVSLQETELTFLAVHAPALLEGKAEIGQPVIDYDTKGSLGALTAYDAAPAYAYVGNNAGEAVRVEMDDECTLTFSCRCSGQLSDTGFFLDGTNYSVGGSYVICVGQTRIACRLASMQPAA